MDPVAEHDWLCSKVHCQVIRGQDEHDAYGLNGHDNIENVSRTYEIVEKSREEANWGRNRKLCNLFIKWKELI